MRRVTLDFAQTRASLTKLDALALACAGVAVAVQIISFNRTQETTEAVIQPTLRAELLGQSHSTNAARAPDEQPDGLDLLRSSPWPQAILAMEETKIEGVVVKVLELDAMTQKFGLEIEADTLDQVLRYLETINTASARTTENQAGMTWKLLYTEKMSDSNRFKAALLGDIKIGK